MKEAKGEEVLCKLGTDLDGKFSSARTAEVNLGNLLADVAMAALQVQKTSWPSLTSKQISQVTNYYRNH